MNYQEINKFYNIVQHDPANYDEILDKNKEFIKLTPNKKQLIKTIIKQDLDIKENIKKKKQTECINIIKKKDDLKQKFDDLKQQESEMCDNNGDQQVSLLSRSLPSSSSLSSSSYSSQSLPSSSSLSSSSYLSQSSPISSTQSLSTYNNTHSQVNPNDHIVENLLHNRLSKLRGGKKSRRKTKKRYKSRRRKTKKHCKSKKRRKTNQRRKKNKCH